MSVTESSDDPLWTLLLVGSFHPLLKALSVACRTMQLGGIRFGVDCDQWILWSELLSHNAATPASTALLQSSPAALSLQMQSDQPRRVLQRCS
jgi:hypothetical protein